MSGVNLAGAEFGQVYPGQENRDYFFPTDQELDYYHRKNINFIRLPILWERVQSVLSGSLEQSYARSIRKVLDAAAAKKMKVILDIHNFGRYGIGKFARGSTHGNFVGSKEVPTEAFTDLWRKLALQFKGHSAIYGYDLMNEPNGDELRRSWKDIAQSAVSAIREVDKDTSILVEGACWSKAETWEQCNQTLLIKDPSEKIIYEAHQYFDHDSVEYPRSYSKEKAYRDVGVDRIKPFVDWLRSHHKIGLIGEYGVPADDPRWLVVMDRFLSYAKANCISTLYWAGGAHWGDYKLSIEPHSGEDSQQMKILQAHSSAL